MIILFPNKIMTKMNNLVGKNDEEENNLCLSLGNMPTSEARKLRNKQRKQQMREQQEKQRQIEADRRKKESQRNRNKDEAEEEKVKEEEIVADKLEHVREKTPPPPSH